MKVFVLLIICLVSITVNAQLVDLPPCQGHTEFTITPQFRTSVTDDAYDITHYSIALELYDTLLYLQGQVTVTATPLNAPLDSFWLELTSALSIDSIRVNGQTKAYNHTNDVVVIPVGSTIALGQTFICEIYYRGVPPQQANRRGMMLSNTGVFPSLFTHSSLFWAKNWLPVKQQLTDKIDSIDIYITTKVGKKVASNGLLEGIDTLHQQKARWHWRSRYPIAYYLVALSVSDYLLSNRQVLLPGRSSPMPIMDFSFPINGPSASLLDTTPRVLKELSRFWGTYPFANEKYGHAQTNMSGAMEHQTLSGMGFYNLQVVIHEAAHQWFGDYVTCATPSDIWLNEGFATYAEALFVEVFDSTAAAAIRNGWISSVRSNALTGSIYVPVGADFNRVLNTNLSYRKPALVLHNLRWLLGDSLFFGGLQYYLNQRGFGNATTEEFRVLMERYTGVSLTNFINAWIYGSGYPDYRINWNQHGSQLYMQFYDRFSASTSLYDLPYPVTVVYTDGRRERLRLSAGFQQIQTFPVQGVVQTIIPDPDNWVLESSLSTVFRDVTLHLRETEKNHLVIFPNPANDLLSISCTLPAKPDQIIAVYDIHGRLQVQRPLEAGSTTMKLETHTLVSGFYFLKCGNVIQRLVIQR